MSNPSYTPSPIHVFQRAGFIEQILLTLYNGLVVVVVLVFYGPSTLFRSFLARSLFLSKNQYLVHILSPVTDNCPIESGGENGRRNYFITNLHKRMLPGNRIKPATIHIPGRRASHQATIPGT